MRIKNVKVILQASATTLAWSTTGLLSPVYAEVLDLDKGEYSTRESSISYTVNSVLDLDRLPAIQKKTLVDDVEKKSAPKAVVAARTSSGKKPRGATEIEALILSVGQKYLRHAGIRRSGLSGTEWLALFRANIAIESNFKQSARSPVGAIGLGQLMPQTARALKVNPYDAEENLHGSARYLLAQLETFGSADLALAAYNAGPKAVSRYGGVPPYRETEGHVRKVLAIFNATL